MMNCKDFKELLSAYADGELSLTQKDFIEEHLTACPDCVAAVNSYKETNMMITSLRKIQTMPDIKDATMSKIKSRQYVKPSRKWLRPALITIAVITILFVTISVWTVTPKDNFSVIKVDMLIYSSIEELGTSPYLNAVVTGTVKSVAGHDKNKGIPLIFYEFEVADVLFGDVDETIIVSLIDTTTEVKTSLDDYVTQFIEGEQLLLFLRERDKSGLSCGSRFYHFYTPISYDNGVFYILDGDIVKPRLQTAFIAETFTIDEIKEIVSNDN